MQITNEDGSVEKPEPFSVKKMTSALKSGAKKVEVFNPTKEELSKRMKKIKARELAKISKRKNR